MTERQINKYLRRQFSAVCWVLIGNYVLMNGMVSAMAMVDTAKQILWNIALGEFPLNIDESALMNNGWGYAASIAVMLVIFHAWKGGAYWKQEVFAKEREMMPGVFFWAMVFCMGCQMLSSLWLTAVETVMNSFGRSVMPVLESLSGSTPTFSMFLYSAVFAPVFEETLFRGYVLRSLRPYGRRFAIVGSALLFGLFHGNLLQGPYAFLAGLIFGIIACEYSIRWSIGLHVFNNLVLAEGLTRLTEAMPLAVADGIHILLLGGSLLLSMLYLFAQREKIRAYRRSEWMDSRCIKCFLTNSGFLVFFAMMTVSMAAFMIL